MFGCPAGASRADAGARVPAEPLEPPSPGPPSLEPPKLGPPSEERAVAPAPVGPAPAATPANEPPAEPEPSRPFSLDAAKAMAASLVPAQRAALALALLKRSLRAFDPTKLPSKLASTSLARPARRPADGNPESTAEPPAPATTAATANAAPAEPDKVEPGVLDVDALDRIRLEIKARLPYFQACADASRRRGGPEVRRLQAVWTIGPDGSIRNLKVENVDDAQLVVCITRMGGRPFAVKPGADLTIPTPIVFVR